MTQHGGPRPGQAKIGAVGVNIPQRAWDTCAVRGMHPMYSVKIPRNVGFNGNVRDFGFDVRVGRVPVLIAYESRPDSCG
jgi:hypothetical protein